MVDEQTPEQAQEPEKPGRYKSIFPHYPGHVQFVHPFTEGHYRAYWNAYNKHEGEKGFDNTESMNQWRAALTILTEKELDGVPAAVWTEKAETVPAEVVTWIRHVSTEYIAPFVNPGRLLARYATGSGET